MNNPADFKNGVNIQTDPGKTRLDYMNELESNLLGLYNSLEGWAEFSKDNIPLVYNIQRKLLIYGQIYEYLGDLAEECERFALWCDAHKKNEFEKYMVEHEKTVGMTAKYKEIHANIAGKKFRVNRDYFKGLAGMWRSRKDSTRENINILKWMIRDVHEAKAGN